MNRTRLYTQLAAGLIILGGSLQASPITQPWISIQGPADSAPQEVVLNYDGTNASGSGVGNGFRWSVTGDSDPLVNWTFGATAPGAYHMVFNMPVVGGPYAFLHSIASVTLSDIGKGGGNPTTISTVTIDGQVPSGTTIPDASFTGSNIFAPDGDTGHASFGPTFVPGDYTGATSMQVVLDFVLNDPDGDGAAAFTGQLLLDGGPGQQEATPEPATSALIGLGLLGIATVGSRRRAKQQ